MALGMKRVVRRKGTHADALFGDIAGLVEFTLCHGNLNFMQGLQVIAHVAEHVLLHHVRKIDFLPGILVAGRENRQREQQRQHCTGKHCFLLHAGSLRVNATASAWFQVPHRLRFNRAGALQVRVSAWLETVWIGSLSESVRNDVGVRC